MFLSVDDAWAIIARHVPPRAGEERQPTGEKVCVAFCAQAIPMAFCQHAQTRASREKALIKDIYLFFWRFLLQKLPQAPSRLLGYHTRKPMQCTCIRHPRFSLTHDAPQPHRPRGARQSKASQSSKSCCYRVPSRRLIACPFFSQVTSRQVLTRPPPPLLQKHYLAPPYNHAGPSSCRLHRAAPASTSPLTKHCDQHHQYQSPMDFFPCSLQT